MIDFNDPEYLANLNAMIIRITGVDADYINDLPAALSLQVLGEYDGEYVDRWAIVTTSIGVQCAVRLRRSDPQMLLTAPFAPTLQIALCLARVKLQAYINEKFQAVKNAGNIKRASIWDYPS